MNGVEGVLLSFCPTSCDLAMSLWGAMLPSFLPCQPGWRWEVGLDPGEGKGSD